MELKYYIADVFTDNPFGGNQLAVFPHAEGIEEPLLQKIAREFNFSETSFVFPPENPKNDCRFGSLHRALRCPLPVIRRSELPLYCSAKGCLSPTQSGRAVFEEKVGEILISWSCKDGLYHDLGMTQPLPVFGPVHDDPATLHPFCPCGLKTLIHDFPFRVFPAVIIFCLFRCETKPAWPA